MKVILKMCKIVVLLTTLFLFQSCEKEDFTVDRNSDTAIEINAKNAIDTSQNVIFEHSTHISLDITRARVAEYNNAGFDVLIIENYSQLTFRFSSIATTFQGRSQTETTVPDLGGPDDILFVALKRTHIKTIELDIRALESLSSEDGGTISYNVSTKKLTIPGIIQNSERFVELDFPGLIENTRAGRVNKLNATFFTSSITNARLFQFAQERIK